MARRNRMARRVEAAERHEKGESIESIATSLEVTAETVRTDLNFLAGKRAVAGMRERKDFWAESRDKVDAEPDADVGDAVDQAEEEAKAKAAAQREEAEIAGMAAILNGADILRVHDVKETWRMIKLFQAIHKYQ